MHVRQNEELRRRMAKRHRAVTELATMIETAPIDAVQCHLIDNAFIAELIEQRMNASGRSILSGQAMSQSSSSRDITFRRLTRTKEKGGIGAPRRKNCSESVEPHYHTQTAASGRQA